VVTLYASAGDDDKGSFFHPLVHFLILGVNGAFLTGDAFNLFLAKVVKDKELLLEDVIPEDTMKAIEDARKGKRMKSITLEEFRKLLNETAGNP